MKSRLFWFAGGTVFALIVVSIVIPAIEPKTQDECVLKNLHRANSDNAVRALTRICGRNFRPTQENTISTFLEEQDGPQIENTPPTNRFEQYRTPSTERSQIESTLNPSPN